MEKLRTETALPERDVCALMICLTAFAQPTRTGEMITIAVLKELEGNEIVEIVSWMTLLTLINCMMMSKAAEALNL